MKYIIDYIDYFNKKNLKNKKNKDSSGVVIIFNNKILLVRSKSSKSYFNFSIPKGSIENGESYRETAHRELLEETGINIDINKLNKMDSITLYNKKLKPVSQLFYFIYEISSLNEIGLNSEIVPKDQLTFETDWAGFVNKEVAYSIINRSQLIILDRHLK